MADDNCCATCSGVPRLESAVAYSNTSQGRGLGWIWFPAQVQDVAGNSLQEGIQPILHFENHNQGAGIPLRSMFAMQSHHRQAGEKMIIATRKPMRGRRINSRVEIF
jgi:hypothetical protein